MKAFFFTILYQPLYNLLILLAVITPGQAIGWAIIFLTVIIRVILLPSSLKAARLQVKNMELQPKINKIRSEIKDQKAQSEALMKLYKDEGVSPLGSCLPLLIQLPILWVLFTVFRNGLTESGFTALYSFVPRPDQINTQFFGFDLTKPDLWILPILAGALQFLLSLLMMPRKKDKTKEIENAPKDPMEMMSKQMLFLPAVMTIFFGRTMPAALVLYWITTTLFSLVQQIYVNKEIKKAVLLKKNSDQEEKAPAKKSTSNDKPAKSGLVTKIMTGKLNRQDRKKQVQVTVRTKKKN